MSGISLTASMRSNLLSLQNISGQVSSTQNKLATGNKVNSAIDNPSSYYTALSLNNRADDLNALLDSMGQAVSTIKAATTALESATEFLEQAKAVEQSMVMDDFYRATKAHVSTKDELLAAAQNAEIKYIIVENNIDMGDTQIVLSEGQSLVGRSYAENDASSVQISFSKTDGKSGIVCNNNTSVSNLKINYQNNSASHGQEAAAIFGQNKTGIKISNVDISFSSTATTVLNQPSAIGFSGASSATLSGNINVNTRDGVIMSINALYGATILFENANVYTSSNVWIQSGHMVVDEQSKIATESRVGFHDGSLDVYGKINCKNSFSTILSNVQFTLHKGAEFNVEDNIWGQLVDGNQIVFEAGSLVGSQDKVYLINKEIAIDGAKKIEPDYFMGNQDFSLTDKNGIR